MASAGRILILPKGNWDVGAEYEILDLVFHNGTSWLAKKYIAGVEPSEANAEHWHKLCDTVDLSEVFNRIAALESQMLSTISLDDIDLSGYALKSELLNYALKTDLNSINSTLTSLDSRLDAAEPKITTLTSDVSTAKTDISNLQTKINGMPSNDNVNKLNYSGEVVKQYNQLPYTCPSAGEVTVKITKGTNGGESSLYIDKNNKPAAYLNTYMTQYVAYTFPVAKGDVINRNGAASNITDGTITFIPYA